MKAAGVYAYCIVSDLKILSSFSIAESENTGEKACCESSSNESLIFAGETVII